VQKEVKRMPGKPPSGIERRKLFRRLDSLRGPAPNHCHPDQRDMPPGSSSLLFGTGMIVMVLVCTMILLAQCGKKPGHDKTPYLLKKKLGLNSDQANRVEQIINETKDLGERERKQYDGDNESLLRAARERDSLEQTKIESILNDKQKATFRRILDEQKVLDHALVISERLGLDRTTTRRINKIVLNAPVEEEVIRIKRSGDPEALRALKERAGRIHEEIESFLTDEQKKAFRKFIKERMTRMNQKAQDQ